MSTQLSPKLSQSYQKSIDNFVDKKDGAEMSPGERSSKVNQSPIVLSDALSNRVNHSGFKQKLLSDTSERKASRNDILNETRSSKEEVPEAKWIKEEVDSLPKSEGAQVSAAVEPKTSEAHELSRQSSSTVKSNQLYENDKLLQIINYQKQQIKQLQESQRKISKPEAASESQTDQASCHQESTALRAGEDAIKKQVQEATAQSGIQASKKEVQNIEQLKLKLEEQLALKCKQIGQNLQKSNKDIGQFLAGDQVSANVRQKMHISQLIAQEIQKSKLNQLDIQKLEHDHCQPLSIKAHANQQPQLGDHIKTPIALRHTINKSSNACSGEPDTEARQMMQSKISMPTQESSQLTWDINQNEPRPKRIKLLNENFLLTSQKQNKNSAQNAKDHNDGGSVDYLAAQGCRSGAIINSAMSSFKEADQQNMSAISNCHGQGGLKNLSRNYNDLSLFLQKSNEGVKSGSGVPLIKSFGGPHGLGLLNQNSSTGLSSMGMLLSSLQKQKKLDTCQKDIQEFYYQMEKAKLKGSEKDKSNIEDSESINRSGQMGGHMNLKMNQQQSSMQKQLLGKRVADVRQFHPFPQQTHQEKFANYLSLNKQAQTSKRQKIDYFVQKEIGPTNEDLNQLQNGYIRRHRQLSFMDQEEFGHDNRKKVSKKDITDDKIRKEIPEGAEIHVENGDEFDFSTIKIDEDIPKTRMFRVFKYKNPRTQRNVKILKCDHKNCGMFFRKWHNFFDHLRVHTGERPFKCNEAGCTQSFTQKANLNKHLAVHQRRKRQKCPMCCKVFASAQILKMHMRQHTFQLTSQPLPNFLQSNSLLGSRAHLNTQQKHEFIDHQLKWQRPQQVNTSSAKQQWMPNHSTRMRQGVSPLLKGNSNHSSHEESEGEDNVMINHILQK